jgi:orotate phosphoribosyltransferase
VDLFQLGTFTLASGQTAPFKIECDALTDNDLDCLSELLVKRLPRFSVVTGVPRGGILIADRLKKYTTNNPSDPILIVDDVYTTGGSIHRHMEAVWSMVDGDDRFVNTRVIGGVFFARTQPPEWITPLFVMTPEYKN